MEHFKRFAFCMLYLFTFIWQLSAQVKKIPQWERFEIVLQGTAKGRVSGFPRLASFLLSV